MYQKRYITAYIVVCLGGFLSVNARVVGADREEDVDFELQDDRAPLIEQLKNTPTQSAVSPLTPPLNFRNFLNTGGNQPSYFNKNNFQAPPVQEDVQRANWYEVRALLKGIDGKDIECGMKTIPQDDSVKPIEWGETLLSKVERKRFYLRNKNDEIPHTRARQRADDEGVGLVLSYEEDFNKLSVSHKVRSGVAVRELDPRDPLFTQPFSPRRPLIKITHIGGDNNADFRVHQKRRLDSMRLLQEIHEHELTTLQRVLRAQRRFITNRWMSIKGRYNGLKTSISTSRPARFLSTVVSWVSPRAWWNWTKTKVIRAPAVPAALKAQQDWWQQDREHPV